MVKLKSHGHMIELLLSAILSLFSSSPLDWIIGRCSFLVVLSADADTEVLICHFAMAGVVFPLLFASPALGTLTYPPLRNGLSSYSYLAPGSARLTQGTDQDHTLDTCVCMLFRLAPCFFNLHVFFPLPLLRRSYFFYCTFTNNLYFMCISYIHHQTHPVTSASSTYSPRCTGEM